MLRIRSVTASVVENKKAQAMHIANAAHSLSHG